MKFITRIMLSLVVAIILELTCFNFTVWQARFDWNTPFDAEYSLDELNAVNWTSGMDGALISSEDPQLLIPTGSMRLYSAEIVFSAAPAPIDCSFYYTGSDGEVKVMEFPAVDDGRLDVELNKSIGPIIRLDIGEGEGTVLSDIKVVVNPMPELHISVSRIIAVVMIYVCGALLFRTQRMPDYHIESVNKVGSDGE